MHDDLKKKTNALNINGFPNKKKIYNEYEIDYQKMLVEAQLKQIYH